MHDVSQYQNLHYRIPLWSYDITTVPILYRLCTIIYDSYRINYNFNDKFVLQRGPKNSIFYNFCNGWSLSQIILINPEWLINSCSIYFLSGGWKRFQNLNILKICNVIISLKKWYTDQDYPQKTNMFISSAYYVTGAILQICFLFLQLS